MIHIGLDPGAKSPAHVVIETLQVHSSPFQIGVGGEKAKARVFVEGQHVRRTRVSMVASNTLSFYAGLHAGAYLAQGCEVWQLPVKAWREAVIPRSGSLKKIVFQNLVMKQTPPEIRAAGPDAVDAYWIGRGGIALLERSPVELKRLKVRKVTWIKKR